MMCNLLSLPLTMLPEIYREHSHPWDFYEGNSKILENLMLAVICRLWGDGGSATVDVVYMETVESQRDRGQMSAVTHQ